MMPRIPLRFALAFVSLIVVTGCRLQDHDTAVATDRNSIAQLPVTDTEPQPEAEPATGASAPVIESFSASASAITRGDSTTLKWKVTGQTGLAITPHAGTINGNSVVVSPKETTTYRLTASNATASTSREVKLTVRDGAGDWKVAEKPPRLVNPKKVDVAKIKPMIVSAQTLNCGGAIRTVRLKDHEDAVIYMSGSKPLRYPLRVTGGRNVRIVGLQFALETQSGCGIGELPNLPVKKHPNANIHPRVPGGIALRVEQWGMTFLEGLNIDVRGHQADCIVVRNPDRLSNSAALKQRDVVVQNTYCSGVEGMGKTDIGDGIHGDFFQNQGGDIMRRLVFENVSMRSSQEGIVLHRNGSQPGAKTLRIRRYDYTWDPRYVGDDSYERFGLAFAGWPASGWKLDDVVIDDYRPKSDYIKIRGERFGAKSASGVTAHPEIRSGRPPAGAYALPGRTGLNYRSPHGGAP